ncbi:hypothetical protein [Kamptonema formosum]|uniref:hypothetical protein n=1 Tax=Kamptonema formosum TaxID=331992 RepID=UPI00037FF569|nr:hypothetical protein [Oscillatoria sp. PCC 10802]
MKSRVVVLPALIFIIIQIALISAVSRAAALAAIAGKSQIEGKELLETPAPEPCKDEDGNIIVCPP